MIKIIVATNQQRWNITSCIANVITAAACDGRAYGSGGGGAANNGSIGSSIGGLGKVGIIRIIG